VPADSTAQVVGDGLLGEKFVGIQAGADDNFLSNNGEIKYTQSSVNFETLLGKFIFGGVEKKSEEKTDTTQEAKPEVK
jgi:phospholipid/cholesterol/gamma-HCH transport system substrate-binding protein